MDRRPRRPFAVLALGLAALPAAAQLRLENGRTFDVSTTSGDAHLVDVDADGHLDLLATRACAGADCLNAVTLLRGDGTGVYVPSATVTLPGQVFASAAADLNGNGRSDLVLSVVGHNDLFVYLGTAAGGLAGPFHVPVGDEAWSIVPADFDGDGRIDLAVSGEFDLHVFLQDALGNFVPASIRQINIALAFPVAADFDGDGRLDLAGARLTCEAFCDAVGVLVLFGDGAGEWTTSVALTAPGELKGLAAGDFDEDGDVDLAASDGESATPASVHLFFSDGAGGFASAVPLVAGFAAASLRAVDADADGHLDLAALTAAGTERDPTRLSLLRGAGDGSFGAPRHAASGGTLALSADLDEDGRIDFLVRNDGTCIEHFGDGTGSFSGLGIAETGRFPQFVGAADLLEDGVADLVSLTGAGSIRQVEVHIADGRGGYVSSRLEMPQAYAISTAADFDEDGHVDIAVMRDFSAVDIRFGSGLGDFPRTTNLSSIVESGSRLLTADVDGNGHADVLGVSRSGFIAFHPGLGDGTFGERTNGSLATAACRSDEIEVATADFDGDGRLDLAATLRWTSRPGRSHCVVVARGLGDGSFAAPSAPISLALDAAKLVTGDFDEDGRVDVATASGSSGIAVFLGNGDATLRVGASRGLGFAPQGIAVADFDGDGHLDLAASDGSAHAVAVLRGNGLGGFSEPERFATGGGPLEVLAFDLDLDDDVDVAVPCNQDDAIWILRNESPIPFLDCRRGNVNVAAGPVTDVLFANESTGTGRARRFVVERDAPFRLRLDAPPSNAAGPAPAAIWWWLAAPTPSSPTKLPRQLGLVAMPTPLTPSRAPQPRLIANSIGFPGRLGTERWPGPPTSPAPTLLLDLPSGLRRPGTYYAQGIIAETSGPNGESAVTNGIELVVR